MMTLNQKILMYLRGRYMKWNHINPFANYVDWKKLMSQSNPPSYLVYNPHRASELLTELLEGDKPCMVARFGATEMRAILNIMSLEHPKSALDYILNGGEYWITDYTRESMTRFSGFFPSTDENLKRFTQMMIDLVPDVDLLGSWLTDEKYFEDTLDCPRVPLVFLDPFWSDKPWTAALKGKRVLVVHPFAKTIEYQYRNNREKLFANPDILPEFKSLEIVPAVQSLGGESKFGSWFEALEHMEAEIDKCDYDVALIGCGAYGMPLAAHVKRMGKKAVHVGGTLQLFFGIIGKRWQHPDYGGEHRWKWPQVNYSKLFNDAWVRPFEEEKPKTASNVEGACYW